MNAAERRTKITHLLAQANGPLSATALAAQCGVSRQIIVGDVALLRAGGLAVLATPRGYILENTSAPACAERHIVSHHDNSRMLEELYTVVDLGGAVIDVTVEHAVYGQICAPLHIFSRYDADAFNEKIQQSGSRPLSNLTGGIHLHTIRATDEKTLERVIQGLKDKGFLLLEVTRRFSSSVSSAAYRRRCSSVRSTADSALSLSPASKNSETGVSRLALRQYFHAARESVLSSHGRNLLPSRSDLMDCAQVTKASCARSSPSVLLPVIRHARRYASSL